MSNSQDDWRKKMASAADAAAQQTDEELAAELTALKAAASADLSALKPEITDQASYDKLIEAVNESTARNESLAQLETRIRGLGEGVLKVAKTAAKLLV